MEAPSFLLPRLSFDLLPEKRDAFDALYLSTPVGELTDYHLPYPKWQYLSYICENRELVLHGSQNVSISVIELRQANDIRQFSNQSAIYATTDGIWVIYFAIVDRKKYPNISLFNTCVQARISPDQLSAPMYFFSLTHSALLQKPWCTGAVYILPRQSFLQESAQQAQGTEIVFPHWISTESVQPVAKLLVDSNDFPFLDHIHGHDDKKLIQLAAADPNGFPWLGALVS